MPSCVNLNTARECWGEASVKRWEEKIQNLAREGWVVLQEDRVRMARNAYLISNEIFQEFVSV